MNLTADALSDPLSDALVKSLATRPNAVLLIDNSNIWIEGKKAAARNASLSLTENPLWRINIGKLVNLMLKCAGLPDEASSVAYGRLFGSIPPPDDTVWARFKQYIDVDLTPRSFHTNKEKRVDSKFVQLATKDSTRLQVLNEFGAPCEFASRLYCMAAGDLDYFDVVRSLLNSGFRVFLFSWEKALNKEYLRLLEQFPVSMAIVYLDSHINEIGFEETHFKMDSKQIPANRTFYVICPKMVQSHVAHGDDFATNFAQAVRAVGGMLLINGFPSYKYTTGDPRSAVATAFILHYVPTPSELTKAIEAARDVFEKLHFPRECVLSFPEYRSSILQPSSVHVSSINQYAVLAIDEDDDIEDPKLFVEEEMSGKEGADEQWATEDLPANRRFQPTQRCLHREFCQKGGPPKCTYGHSEKEKVFLVKCHGCTIYKLQKTTLCPYEPLNSCTAVRSINCRYRHSNEAVLCINCLGTPCNVKGCSLNLDRDIISQAEAIRLKKTGYIKV